MVFTGYINKKNKTNRKIIMEKKMIVLADKVINLLEKLRFENNGELNGYEMSFPLRARD